VSEQNVTCYLPQITFQAACTRLWHASELYGVEVTSATSSLSLNLSANVALHNQQNMRTAICFVLAAELSMPEGAARCSPSHQAHLIQLQLLKDIRVFFSRPVPAAPPAARTSH
jgi:hypothetical protein